MFLVERKEKTDETGDEFQDVKYCILFGIDSYGWCLNLATPSHHRSSDL
jgi:hypothetical protein